MLIIDDNRKCLCGAYMDDKFICAGGHRSTNEMRILREFLLEFNPFFTEQIVLSMGYNELIGAVRETVVEM